MHKWQIPRNDKYSETDNGKNISLIPVTAYSSIEMQLVSSLINTCVLYNYGEFCNIKHFPNTTFQNVIFYCLL